MTPDQHTAAETVGGMTAKLAPGATVSLATIAGYQVSELVLWATLIYTCLMIGHKLIAIVKEFSK